jgi:hypothetical protein
VSCSSTALMSCFLGLASESLWGSRIGSGSKPAPLILAEPRDQLDLTTSDLRFDCLLLNMRLNFGDPIKPTKSISSWFPLSSAISAAAVCRFPTKISNGLGSLTCQIRGNQSGKRCQHLPRLWSMNDYEELMRYRKQWKRCAFF